MSFSPSVAPVILLAVGLVVFLGALLARRRLHHRDDIDMAPWASTLGYVATAYGVVIGFSIVFLFGEFSDARRAVGDEATSIGTAFEEVRLFPEVEPEVQHALICYAQAVSTYEWPAMRQGDAAPEVDVAYRNIIEALGAGTEPATSTFQPAAATNIFAQVGNISTAREQRLVAATTTLPPMLVVLLLGGGLFVLVLIFMSTMSASPLTQAALMGLAAVFTAVMVLIVFALATPFSQGQGRVNPELIDQTLASMQAEAPGGADRACELGP